VARFGHGLVTGPGSWGAPTDDTELVAASLVEPVRFAELSDRHFPGLRKE
jgi:hypothetical protein